MGGFEIVLFIVAIGLLFLSRLFLKQPNVEKTIQQDDGPQTLSSRGVFCNHIIGQYRTGPFFAWAGDQFKYTKEEVIGHVDGGKKGDSSDITQTVNFMPGWHVIDIGPASSLIAIFENKKEVWRGPISRATTPSGSTIDAGTVGTFRIYWGEIDQPIDPTLRDKMGINSRWPNIIHIVWDPKRLGTSNTWQDLEYEFEKAFECVPGLGEPYMLDDGETRGVNPAHVLFQLLTGEFPYGIGIPIENIDILSFRAVALLCRQEHLPCNLEIADNTTADKVIQGILADIGCFLTDSPKKDKLMLVPLRENVGDIPEFTDDVVLAPDLEVNISTEERDVDRVVFSFKDAAQNFRDNDIKIDNDGDGVELHRYKNTDVALTIPTHIKIATKISDRRIQEPFGDDGNFKVTASRAAGLLLPGQAFSLPNVGIMRVFSKKPDTFSASTVLSCILDSYAVESTSEVDNDGSTPPDESEGAAMDLAFTFVEIPIANANGQIAISVFRIRANTNISGALIWVNVSGGSYQTVGRQTRASAGGPLLSGIALGTEDVIAVGPIIESMNSDIQDVRDLTTELPAWQAGTQIMLINQELFFLKKAAAQAESDWLASTNYSIGDSVIPALGVTGWRYVCTSAGTSGASEPAWPKTRLGTVVDGGATWEARGFRYELQGLIRARGGTVQGLHMMDDIAYIIPQSSVSAIGSAIFMPGSTVCVKTQPYTSRNSVDVSMISPLCKQLSGGGTGFLYLNNEAGDYLTTHLGENLSIEE